MKLRLYNAIAEYIEARSEHVREVTSSISLGTYARGYKEGQADLMEQVDVVYVGGDEEDDED
jgi:hypothetical protein